MDATAPARITPPPADEEPYEDVLAEVRDLMEQRGQSQADVARGMGYTTEAGMVYVRRILGGKGAVSRPVLVSARRFLQSLPA